MPRRHDIARSLGLTGGRRSIAVQYYALAVFVGIIANVAVRAVGASDVVGGFIGGVAVAAVLLASPTKSS